jgi:predicted small secreted protein
MLERIHMKKISMALVAGAFLVLAGCNTVAGMGKDVSKVGDKTTEAAHTTSQDIHDQSKK